MPRACHKRRSHLQVLFAFYNFNFYSFATNNRLRAAIQEHHLHRLFGTQANPSSSQLKPHLTTMSLEKAQPWQEAQEPAAESELRQPIFAYRRRRNIVTLFLLARFGVSAIDDIVRYFDANENGEVSEFEVRGSRGLAWSIVLWAGLTLLSFVLVIQVWISRRRLGKIGGYRAKVRRESEMERAMAPWVIGGVVYGSVHLKVKLFELVDQWGDQH
ncbi:hypothetical protein VTL71DRAFT_535 [Oculimacula yallundae]|uniref:EF-hand domain-containing protein n=1 Tax=Oculimacula yallundae TaxID=86028 RepID=A0ABR4D0C1_9HELO